MLPVERHCEKKRERDGRKNETKTGKTINKSPERINFGTLQNVGNYGFIVGYNTCISSRLFANYVSPFNLWFSISFSFCFFLSEDTPSVMKQIIKKKNKTIWKNVAKKSSIFFGMLVRDYARLWNLFLMSSDLFGCTKSIKMKNVFQASRRNAIFLFLFLFWQETIESQNHFCEI